MNIFQPDGFPTTFSLSDAAAVTNISVSRLRNYVARNILQHVGQIPLAGQERRFAVWCLYEIGLIAALNDADYTLDEAAKIVHNAFMRSLTAGYLRYCNEHPEQPTPAFDAAQVEAMPKYWLNGFWTHRDLTEPAIWVFGHLHSMVFGPSPAKGWHDVPAVAIELQKEVYSTITPTVPDEVSGERTHRPAKIGDNHAFPQSGLKVLGLLNVTAVLAEIDAAIEAHLAKSPAKQ
jgi:hypothetical protein